MKEIQHRTFDQLLGEVATDFHSFNREGFIEPAQLIKIAQKINSELGLKIHTRKEKVIELCHGKAQLPSDLHSLERVILCSKYKIISGVIMGRQTEDVILDPDQCTKCGEPDPTCSCEKTYTLCDGTHVQVIEKKKFQTRAYEEFVNIYLKPSKYAASVINCRPHETPYHGEIKDNFLYVSGVDTGNVYIVYEGAMEDEDGNLLVLDHPIANTYYETALKEFILQNLYFNGEDVEKKWQYMKEEKRQAKIAAHSFVNMPDFRDLYEVWKMNRKAQYGKYYDPFKS